VGFDLDGTIAYYEPGYCERRIIGPPIQTMIIEMNKWINAGFTVKIFTARVAEQSSIKLIQTWLRENNLPEIEITNIKDPGLFLFYDDRAVHVRRNTGEVATSKKDIVRACSKT
jgi:hypothetical protein